VVVEKNNVLNTQQQKVWTSASEERPLPLVSENVRNKQTPPSANVLMDGPYLKNLYVIFNLPFDDIILESNFHLKMT